MKREIFVPFAEWAPDSSNLITTEGHTGILPRNFKRLKDGGIGLPPFSGGMSSGATFQGGFACVSNAGEVFNILGGGTTLGKLTTAGGVSDVSRTVGGAYTITSGGLWDFARFGDTIYAANINDTLQALPMSGTDFADVSSDNIRGAAHIDVVRDFVVLGNINEGGTKTNYRVRWSALNNPASWTVDGAKQADFQDLPDTGEIMSIVGGEEGTILCERGIWKMKYVGTPVIFQFDKIADVGPMGHGCTAMLGQNIYFLGRDGFYRLRPDGTLDPIGAGRVNEYFWQTYSQTTNKEITCAVDTLNRAVLWGYRGMLYPFVYFDDINEWTRGEPVGGSFTADALFDGIVIPNSTSDVYGVPRYSRVPVVVNQPPANTLYFPVSRNAGIAPVLHPFTKIVNPGGGRQVVLQEARLIYDGDISSPFTLTALFDTASTGDLTQLANGVSPVVGAFQVKKFRARGSRFQFFAQISEQGSYKGLLLTFSDAGGGK